MTVTLDVWMVGFMDGYCLDVCPSGGLSVSICLDKSVCTDFCMNVWIVSVWIFECIAVCLEDVWIS